MRALACLLLLSATALLNAQDLSGYWEGPISIAGQKLRIGLNLTKKGDGYTATMDSPDQQAMGIPVQSVAVDGTVFTLDMTALGAKYEGTLSADGKEIVGKFTQGGMTMDLTLRKLDKKPEPKKRPQEPKKPYPYKEEQVKYENKVGKVRLAGTLTIPKGKGPFPAALLITGSGAQNRDEELLGHKPFLVLADHLTRRGIAVLRVDDRGVGGSSGSVMQSTSQDFSGDVLAGIAFLKTRKEVNAKKIGVIGHSEGGIVGPMAAARSKDIAFVVMMAGTGVTGEEILYEQGRLISKAGGASDADLARSRDLQVKSFAAIKKGLSSEDTEKELAAIAKDALTKMSEAEKTQVGGEAGMAAQLKALNSPWFRSFLFYDPRLALEKLKCPVLAINGSLDLQVPPKQNLPEIRKALKRGGNRDFTIKEFPGLNHLFQHAKTGSPAEYAMIEETISPEALATISDWILAHSVKPKRGR